MGRGLATDSLVAFYVYQSPSSHHFAPFPPQITVFKNKLPVGHSLPIQFDTINSLHLHTLDRTNNNYTIGLHHERQTTQAWSCPVVPLCVSSLSSTKLTKLYCTSIAVMDNVNEINLIKGATSLLTTAINLIKGTTLIAFTLCIGLYVYRRDPFRCQTKGKLRRRAQTQQRAQTPPRRKKKKKLGTPSNLYTSRQLFTATVGQDQDQDQYDDRLIPDERTLKSPGKFSTCKSVQY